MLVIAAYLWSDPHWRHNSAFTYKPSHVLHLRDMVSNNITVPHEFACITDDPQAFQGTGIRPIPIDWTTHVPNTEFVKLMTFHPEGKALIGERVFQMDLDTVVTGNIDEIVSRPEPLVVWRNPTRVPYDNPVKRGRPYYNGSVILHQCGLMPEIWREFDKSLVNVVRDTQVWMSEWIGPNAPHWDGAHHGIYRLARKDTPGSGIWGDLTANARIVNFVGSEHKPWNVAVREANPWVAQYWPEGL